MAAIAAGGVLVGVDGSGPADLAVDWAAGEAAARGTTLTVCHVWNSAPLPDPYGTTPYGMSAGGPDVVRELDARGHELAAAAAARAAALVPGLTIHTRVAGGQPAWALVRQAAGAELLVVGSRGHGGFASLLLGSVSQQVAAHAAVPVAVIRPSTGGGPFRRHVVVGVDGSPAGDAVLEFAFSAAAQHGLPLAAVHVLLLTPVDSYVDDQTLELHLEGAVPGRDLLDRAVDPWAAKFPSVRVKRAVHHGSPVDGLRRAAAGSALLVVGRRGHDGFASLLLGSASQALLLHASCPVAVVGPSLPG